MKQINLELKASHIYLSMASYFARDNVALPGLHQFFKKSSEEEREHAEKLIDYQNKRGGKVAIQGIPAPDVRTCWNTNEVRWNGILPERAWS
jgi:ferritin heavy chain